MSEPSNKLDAMRQKPIGEFFGRLSKILIFLAIWFFGFRDF